jgi:hypothetical protein
VYPASQSLQTRPRLLLIVLLVELGLAVPGAILGSIGASLADILIGRCYIRPTPFHRPRCATRQLWDYAVPLFLAALSLRLYEKLDLFALKALGATAEQAGMYGAVQSLALVPGIFALAFSPLLLATLSRTLRAGDSSLAREISRDALRVPLVLLPFAGLTAGAAHEIIGLIFGAAFLPATPLLALLIFAAVALVMLSVVTAILTAADKPGWTFVLTGPLVLLALIGQPVVDSAAWGHWRCPGHDSRGCAGCAAGCTGSLSPLACSAPSRDILAQRLSLWSGLCSGRRLGYPWLVAPSEARRHDFAYPPLPAMAGRVSHQRACLHPFAVMVRLGV